MAFFRCNYGSSSSVPSSITMTLYTLANSRPANCYTSMKVHNIGWTKIRKHGGNMYPSNVLTLYCYDPADEDGTKFSFSYNEVDYDISSFSDVAIKVVNSNTSVSEMNIEIPVTLS